VERERGPRIRGNQTNGDMCFLSLVGRAWRLDKHRGEDWKLSLSHFHSRAPASVFSSSSFFSDRLRGKGGESTTRHARVSVNGRKYYWRRAPLHTHRSEGRFQAVCRRVMSLHNIWRSVRDQMVPFRLMTRPAARSLRLNQERR